MPRYGQAVAVVTPQPGGSLDTRFANPNLTAAAGTITASSVAIQADGKVLVVGSFTTAGAGGQTRRRLARFNVDGTLDTTFADPNLGDSANAIAIQPDGRILVGGVFTTAGGQTRGRLARFNADGSLDTTFADPNLSGTANGIAIQSDGKILVAGAFATAGGQTRSRLARFNADGTLDTSFADPNLGGAGNTTGYGVAVQPDGKVLISGIFLTAGSKGEARKFLARFNADGSLDATFKDPGISTTSYHLAVQPDGKILLSGNFTTVGGQTRGRLARFNTDGSLDTTFANPNLGSFAFRVAVQPDGKVLVVGDFSSAGSQGLARAGVARFHTDGSLDTTFANPALAIASGRGLVIDRDGLVYVSGQFTTVGGVTRGRLARLYG